MLSHLPCGQRARNQHSESAHQHVQASLQDARLAAWALAVGDIRDADGRSYRISRPHRGQLPDVDFALVAPDPAYRPLIVRAADALRRLFRRKASRVRSGSTPQGQSPPLGESPPMSYMGVTEAGDPRDYIRTECASAAEISRAA